MGQARKESEVTGSAKDERSVWGAPAVRVVIIDDHESARLGVETACRVRGYQVVATLSSAEELHKIPPHTCDVIVLDLSLGDGSRITDNVTLALAKGAVVVVHSIANRVSRVREALWAGAAGVIPKSSPLEALMTAIKTLANGETLSNEVFSPGAGWVSVTEWANSHIPRRVPLASPYVPPHNEEVRASKVHLGPRERDVLHLYASGLPLKIAAAQLGISYATAREYINRVRTKYAQIGRAAPTKIDLLRRAVEDGILPPLRSGDEE